MTELLQGVAFFLTGTCSALCGLLAWRIARGDPQQWDENRRKVRRGERLTAGDIHRALLP
jgi:hypothetical protein